MTSKIIGVIAICEGAFGDEDKQAVYALRMVDYIQVSEAGAGAIVAICFEAPLRSDVYEERLGRALARLGIFARIEPVAQRFPGGSIAQAAPFVSQLAEMANRLEPKIPEGAAANGLDDHVERLMGWRTTCRGVAQMSQSILVPR